MRNFLSEMTVFSKVGPPEPETDDPSTAGETASHLDADGGVMGAPGCGDDYCKPPLLPM
jgi:hypothetical protein